MMKQHLFALALLFLFAAVAEGQPQSIALPLDGWREVGVALSESDALTARYKVAPKTPQGAVLMMKPGTLDGVTSLRVRIRANRNTTLILSLQDANGVAYAFPSVNTKAGVRDVELSVEDLVFLPQQSRAADPGSYTLANTIMLGVFDISGYMSDATPEVEWTLESLEAVR